MSGKKRILALDAMRGLTVAAMLLVNNAGDWDHVYPWLEHAEWNGCTPADFIFPFFLFMVGVSLECALGSRTIDPLQRPVLLRELWWRALRIVLLGLALHVFAMLTIEGRAFRLFGVLQRIGICFAFAAAFALYCRPRMQWVIAGVILVVYGALLMLFGMESIHNPERAIDSRWLGHLAYQYDAASGQAFDPEGMLTTFPALVTVLLGLRAGAWLRQGATNRLLLVGAVAMTMSYFVAQWMPFNKQLWTPSFAVWSGGAGMLTLWLLYRLIDGCGFPAIGASFGVNAIAAYALSWIGTCLLAYLHAMPLLYDRGLVPLMHSVMGSAGTSFAFAASFTALLWLLAWQAKRQGVRIVI